MASKYQLSKLYTKVQNHIKELSSYVNQQIDNMKLTYELAEKLEIIQKEDNEIILSDLLENKQYNYGEVISIKYDNIGNYEKPIVIYFENNNTITNVADDQSLSISITENSIWPITEIGKYKITIKNAILNIQKLTSIKQVSIY